MESLGPLGVWCIKSLSNGIEPVMNAVGTFANTIMEVLVGKTFDVPDPKNSSKTIKKHIDFNTDNFKEAAMVISTAFTSFLTTLYDNLKEYDMTGMEIAGQIGPLLLPGSGLEIAAPARLDRVAEHPSVRGRTRVQYAGLVPVPHPQSGGGQLRLGEGFFEQSFLRDDNFDGHTRPLLSKIKAPLSLERDKGAKPLRYHSCCRSTRPLASATAIAATEGNGRLPS